MNSLVYFTSRPRSQSQRGFVLIIVFTIIILASGLGLMAVRHSRQEARSTGAYVDSTQAIALAESAMAVAITDLRKAPDYYKIMFSDPSSQIATADLWDIRYAIDLSAQNFPGNNGTSGVCGIIPDRGCSSILSSPEYDEGGGATGDDLYPGSEFATVITYDTPLVGPCPPGFSCFDDQNYGWYVFGINVEARYGVQSQWLLGSKFVEHGRALGSGRVTIGPIGVYGR